MKGHGRSYLEWVPVPSFFLGRLPHERRDPIEVLREAVGHHYDVREEEIVERDDDGQPIKLIDGSPLIIDRLIVICQKGSSTPLLTLWTN